jgi:trehalose-6-phosphatase
MPKSRRFGAPGLAARLSSVEPSQSIRLLLDYDGTLVPIVRDPELAAPDDEVLWLLASLASDPRIRVDLVSGRPRDTLEQWFGQLGDVLSNQPFEVTEGKKVIEVRLRGVSKALAARQAIRECDPSTLVVAIGDDRTDEDLFRALPGSAVTVAVGVLRRAPGFASTIIVPCGSCCADFRLPTQVTRIGCRSSAAPFRRHWYEDAGDT